jgi:hypothetical protein
MSSSYSSVSTIFLQQRVLSSNDPVGLHLLISLDMQDFVGMGESGYLRMNLSSDQLCTLLVIKKR